MNILITGLPGSGKTTLLQAIVSDLQKELNIKGGGFYTKEIRSGNTRTGFSLVTLGGEARTFAHVEIQSPHKVGKYGVDTGVLDRIGVAAIRSAMREKDMIVIDEIGKMELYSARFKQSVLEALDDEKVLLATIGEFKHPFADGVRKRKDVCLLETDRGNQDRLRTKIINLILKSLKE
jgi:nucleoside-triphosphatase